MWNLVLLTIGKRSKVADYYEKQERLLEGYTEMETVAANDYMPGSLTEVGCLLQPHTHTHTHTPQDAGHVPNSFLFWSTWWF